METKFYTDDFEQLLKEKSDEFRMYPSKRVWHSIYNDLHPGRKWPSVAVSLILIIALLMVGYWNDHSSVPLVNASQKTNQPLIASLAKNKAAATYALTADLVPGDIKKLPVQSNTVSTNTSKNIIAKNNHPYNNLFTPTAIYLAGNEKNVSSQNDNIPGSAILFSVAGSITDKIVFTAAKENERLVFINDNSLFITDAVLAKTKSFSPNAPTRQQLKAAIAAALITKKEMENRAIVINNSGSKITGNSSQDNDIEKNAVPAEGQENTLTAVNGDNGKEKATADVGNESKSSRATTANSVAVTETSDRVWIEDYAFHNKSRRKAWQDRTSIGFYATPSIGYRDLSNNSKYNSTGGNANKSVSHNAGLNFEAGFNINYSIAKKIKVTAGVQANYTNYGINAEEINHPVLTTIMLLDPNSGYPYMKPATSTLANTPGYHSTKIHNTTYQVSVPIGLALKLSGNDNLEWYAGATIQPSFVVGGKAYVISSDRKNYVADASLLRKWNLNSSFETYINYKMSNFTLQAGPQFRYQLLSTYYKKYTVKENLYNVGFKIGILKNF
jgi:hypothetical protein